MNSPIFSRLASLTVAAITAASFVACAPPRAPLASGAPGATTTTGAEVSSASPSAPSDGVPESGSVPAASEPDPVVGQLVCRSKSPTEGTSELFLEWKGAAATGVLRRVAPSGMVYHQNVRAERSGATIVADDTCGETDLVSHAATIGEQNGKRYMRLGDGSRSWTACE